MMVKVLGRLQCSHISEQDVSVPTALFLPSGQTLELCNDCSAVVHLSVLQGIISDALRQVFEAQVGDVMQSVAQK